MTYKLYLDDERNPPIDGFLIARSFKEARNLLIRDGFPTFISFDHDLGEGGTGYDFAKYLIEFDLNHDCMPKDFSFAVHSENPVGKENIEYVLNSYIEYKRNV